MGIKITIEDNNYKLVSFGTINYGCTFRITGRSDLYIKIEHNNYEDVRNAVNLESGLTRHFQATEQVVLYDCNLTAIKI